MPTAIVRRPPPPLIAELPVSPLLQRIYAARGVRSAGELERGLRGLASPSAFKNMTQAVDLLHAAFRERWRIVIVADLDADGATSCALAVRALRVLGAAEVRYVVPNRFVHGYGLTPEIVAVAAQQQPDLLITVDNGISSHEGVLAAQALGMKVLITDHHLPGLTLPAADALVNPNQPGDQFPSKHLAGVGVIFHVLTALRTRLREAGWFAAQGLPEPNLAQFLDLAALGTVADVVTLDYTNRILVEQGLQRIRAGRCVPGILALLEIAKRPAARVTATDLAFQLGPRINAAGRLDDMSLSIDCLLCDDLGQARQLAQQLDDLNRERKTIEADMQDQALAGLARLPLTGSELPFGLCLFDPDWHPGVVGIVAGRVKEQAHRPVIAFAPDNADGQLRGSARSVAGFHIRDALATIAAQQPGLMTRFGGHAFAAGLSLPAAHLEAFRAAFDAEARRILREEDLQGCLWSDGELAAAEIALETAEQLRAGGPWGQGFPEPVFDNVFEVVSQQPMGGGKHLKLGVQLPGMKEAVEAVVFNRAEPCPSYARLAYQLDVNEWRDSRRLQLLVRHVEAAGHHH
jgi:single-stranded-DNA-specific exonuclease